jgi:hypothetical protein
LIRFQPRIFPPVVAPGLSFRSGLFWAPCLLSKQDGNAKRKGQFPIGGVLSARSWSVGCRFNVAQYEGFGHEKKTVAAGHGVGSPLPLLKSGAAEQANAQARLKVPLG